MKFFTGYYKPSPNIASCTFRSAYWILTIIILTAYTGNLVAYMAVTKLQLPLDSLKELTDHPEYQASLLIGTSTQEERPSRQMP